LQLAAPFGEAAVKQKREKLFKLQQKYRENATIRSSKEINECIKIAIKNKKRKWIKKELVSLVFEPCFALLVF